MEAAGAVMAMVGVGRWDVVRREGGESSAGRRQSRRPRRSRRSLPSYAASELDVHALKVSETRLYALRRRMNTEVSRGDVTRCRKEMKEGESPGAKGEERRDVRRARKRAGARASKRGDERRRKTKTNEKQERKCPKAFSFRRRSVTLSTPGPASSSPASLLPHLHPSQAQPAPPHSSSHVPSPSHPVSSPFCSRLPLQSPPSAPTSSPSPLPLLQLPLRPYASSASAPPPVGS